MYYGWILLASIGTIYMITTGAVFYGLSVMMPAMIEDLGWTRAQATTGFAILSLVIGFAGPVVTMAMKKLSPRITIILGGFVSAIGALILYNYHSLTVYYAAAVLLACGMTMQSVLPGTQLVTQWFNIRRSLALGIFMAAGGLGGVVGAPTFSLLIEILGDWRPVWLFVGGVCLTASLISWAFVRNYPADKGQTMDGIPSSDVQHQANSPNTKPNKVYKTNKNWTVKEAFADYAYWVVLVSGAIAVTGYMTVNSQLVLHAKDMGMTAVLASSALGLQGILTTSGRFISGLLGDFAFEPKLLFAIGLGGECLGTLLLNFASNPFMLYLAAIIFGLGFGLGLVASTTLLANFYGSANTATLLSYRILISTILGSIGAVVAGYSADVFGGYQEVFYAYAAIMLAGTFLVSSIPIPKGDKNTANSG